MDFDELVIEYLSGSLRGVRVRTFLDMIDADERCIILSVFKTGA